MWKIKKIDFWQKIAWHYLCQEGKQKTRIFVAHYLFWPKFFFWTKTVLKQETL